MDELSHFTGASKLTVNIRGNDIDFTVLWLQMSLVLSFSFSFLRKKKKTQPSLLDLIYTFPFSASLFLEQERWKQSHTWHMVGTQHQKSLWKSQSQMWLPCPFCPKCVMHDKEGIPGASFPALPLPAPQLRDPLQLPRL